MEQLLTEVRNISIKDRFHLNPYNINGTVNFMPPSINNFINIFGYDNIDVLVLEIVDDTHTNEYFLLVPRQCKYTINDVAKLIRKIQTENDKFKLILKTALSSYKCNECMVNKICPAYIPVSEI